MSHLAFADDVIIFSKVLERSLEIFMEFLGLHKHVPQPLSNVNKAHLWLGKKFLLYGSK